MGVVEMSRFPHADVVADTTDMSRDEWLELRRGGIGGSDAAVLCNLSNYVSPFELWLDKTGQFHDDSAGEAALWGSLLEATVREEVARRLDTRIERVALMLSSKRFPFMYANIDGDAVDLNAVYEGKTGSKFKADEWAGDDVPPGYVVQGMHYLAVTGRSKLLYGVLLGGQRLEIRHLTRDDELIDMLVGIEQEFWDHVLSGEPPPVDGSKACTDLLQGLYDVRPDQVLTVVDDDEQLVRSLVLDRHAAKAEEDTAAKRRRYVENQLKQICGDNSIVADPAGKALFTWKEHQRSAVDLPLLSQVHTDLVDGFRTSAPQRRLYIPKTKEN